MLGEWFLVVLASLVFFLCFSGLGVAAAMDDATGHAGGPPSSDYEPVWHDEFNGDTLDLSKWGYRQLGPRRKAVNTRDAVSLDGQGHLVLTTSQVGNAYHTAMISTQGKFETTFGYFETRVRFQRQQGHWSAFWLQSPTLGQLLGDTYKSGTEIDVFEFLGNQRDTVHINLHWDGYGEHHKSTGSKYRDAALADGFRVVGLEWTPQEYVFYVDGREVWRTRTAISHAAQYIILSLEVDKWAGDIGKAILPDSAIFDYVRVYKKRGRRSVPARYSSMATGTPLSRL